MIPCKFQKGNQINQIRNSLRRGSYAMSDGFTIGAAGAASSPFPCPQCKETIDNTAETCRFCGQPVDHAAAAGAAQLLSKINQACSDASYMKSCALAVPVFFVVRYIPFISGAGGLGFLGLGIGIPIWSFIWWFKYGSIQADDADFIRARRTVRIAGISVFLAFVLFILVQILLGVFIALHRR
jgi:hypothetical protein